MSALVVLDLGGTAADVESVLSVMDGDGLELVGVDGSHVGCRVIGLLREVAAPIPGKRYRIELVEVEGESG